MTAVIDAGSLVWETAAFDSLDDLFDRVERAIGRWSQQRGIELVDHQGNIIPWPED
jgi:hypothetical protein